MFDIFALKWNLKAPLITWHQKGSSKFACIYVSLLLSAVCRAVTLIRHKDIFETSITVYCPVSLICSGRQDLWRLVGPVSQRPMKPSTVVQPSSKGSKEGKEEDDGMEHLDKEVHSAFSGF